MPHPAPSSRVAPVDLAYPFDTTNSAWRTTTAICPHAKCGCENTVDIANAMASIVCHQCTMCDRFFKVENPKVVMQKADASFLRRKSKDTGRVRGPRTCLNVA